jgi:hypothetical protein
MEKPLSIQVRTISATSESFDIVNAVYLEIRNTGATDMAVLTSNGGRLNIAPGGVRTLSVPGGYLIKDSITFQGQQSGEILMLIK